MESSIDSERDAKRISLCTECGAPARNHCKGGKWGGCCRTWTGHTAFDRHRVGAARCMTDGEMAEAGARPTARGWTFGPPMDREELVARLRKKSAGG